LEEEVEFVVKYLSTLALSSGFSQATARRSRTDEGRIPVRVTKSPWTPARVSRPVGWRCPHGEGRLRRAAETFFSSVKCLRDLVVLEPEILREGPLGSAPGRPISLSAARCDLDGLEGGASRDLPSGRRFTRTARARRGSRGPRSSSPRPSAPFPAGSPRISPGPPPAPSAPCPRPPGSRPVERSAQGQEEARRGGGPGAFAYCSRGRSGTIADLAAGDV
jgi:hypothetical protein